LESFHPEIPFEPSNVLRFPVVSKTVQQFQKRIGAKVAELDENPSKTATSEIKPKL
jgi:hypothetical protein